MRSRPSKGLGGFRAIPPGGIEPHLAPVWQQIRNSITTDAQGIQANRAAIRDLEGRIKEAKSRIEWLNNRISASLKGLDALEKVTV
jgi:hypothetical protein